MRLIVLTTIVVIAKGTTIEKSTSPIKIGKCCEPREILLDDTCTPIDETNETQWVPEFVNEKDVATRSSDYGIVFGLPRCDASERQWRIYQQNSGQDRLAITLPSGLLRHYTTDLGRDQSNEEKFIHLDYPFGHYCVDKVILTRDRMVASYALVCVPEVVARWTDAGYLMRRVVEPITRAISIAGYLIVAIVYFVLPQLRDLVGNMITSMTLCLIVGQCASIVNAFKDFSNHFDFLILDFIAHVSLLAAFFWLNAFGYYVWNTFRSRNVFLRVTDGKKYCYYSTYVWGSTATISLMAIFAQLVLETDPSLPKSPQRAIGWLGLSVLFLSIAFTIIVDLCFALTTANRIKRINTYGRIHHKMKYSFKMYVLIYAIMTADWFSILFSRLEFDALTYCRIVFNAVQALSMVYVCVFGQRRVTFLLSKTCDCCNSGDNAEGLDWGEEMTAINAGY